MLIEETFRVKAPIQKVWEFLLDPEKIGPCIPGCEKIEPLRENAYESTIKVNLPILSITVKCITTVTEMTAPNHLKSATEGKYDIGSGTFHQETVIDLREISDNEVEVSYAADTNLGGELAGFAEKIVSSMAKGLGERFARNIREKLESGRTDEGFKAG
jgi:carbon monoxide dehydrogenase subunit G